MALYSRMEPTITPRSPLPLLNALPGAAAQPLAPAAQTLGGDGNRALPNTPAAFWEALNQRVAPVAQPGQAAVAEGQGRRTRRGKLTDAAKVRQSDGARRVGGATPATPASPAGAAPAVPAGQTIAGAAMSPVMASAPAFTGQHGYTRTTTRLPATIAGMA